MNKLDIKGLLPYLAAIVIFAIVAGVYFNGQFSNKRLQAGDFISWQGMNQEIKDFEKKTGEEILWTNSMFGGMPAYQIGGSQNKNLLKYVKKTLSLGLSSPAGLFVLGMICFFILLVSMGVNPWLSIIGGISFAFMTNNLVLLEAGHMTKVGSIMVSPLVISGVLLTFKRKYAAGFIVFALGMGLNLMSNHFQMTYYLGLILLIYVIYELVKAIREKELKHFTKASLFLLFGLFLAIGSTSSKLWTTYEYSRDTMRGKPILEKTKGEANSSSNVEGLEWNYAMNWSNGWIDLYSSFIPMVVGGSSAEDVGNDSAFAQQLRKAGYGSRNVKAPLYWGGLPSTSGPIYFGAVMFFLFVFGCFYFKGAIKWWILGATILTMLLSLGKNFEFFNRLFFDYFPLFNKFRTPNSVLSITSIIVPLLGMLALAKALKEEQLENLKKPLMYTTGILGAVCLLIALLGSSMFEFAGASDFRFKEFTDALVEDRMSLSRSSSLSSLFYILLSGAILYGFMKSKLKAGIVIALFGALILFDQMKINLNYVNSESFVSKRSYDQYFAKRKVDEQILRDSDLSYRVLDLSINTFNSSRSSYHHKTIGGYHAAKLQRYQDVIDNHISRNNQAVLNMLNTKYIISGEPGKEDVMQNPAALDNAWFVNNITMVNSPDEEINALSRFDPAGDAIVHKEFSSYVSGFSPEKNGTINLVSYRPDLLKYQSNSSSDQLAVFSEIWYGPNKGWTAYIDGKEVPHIRANYLLRALKVPAGNHEIEFVFKPKSYYLGEWISLVCSALIILGGLWLGFKEFRSEV